MPSSRDVPQPGDPSFVNDPALPRFASIVADLTALGASDWEVNHPPLSTTTDYTDRITAVSDELPRHIAHHYTRYLGDLSGGQSIAKRVADHYGATPDQLSFYRFDAIDRPARSRSPTARASTPSTSTLIRKPP